MDTRFFFFFFLLFFLFFFLYKTTKLTQAPYEGWVVHASIQNEDDATKYSWSFYWTVATMMAVGYGDVHPRTTQEMLYAILAQTVKKNNFLFSKYFFHKFSIL